MLSPTPAVIVTPAATPGSRFRGALFTPAARTRRPFRRAGAAPAAASGTRSGGARAATATARRIWYTLGGSGRCKGAAIIPGTAARRPLRAARPASPTAGRGEHTRTRPGIVTPRSRTTLARGGLVCYNSTVHSHVSRGLPLMHSTPLSPVSPPALLP